MKAIVADIKEGKKVKIYGRPELGYGEVFRITEGQEIFMLTLSFKETASASLNLPENMWSRWPTFWSVTRRESRINQLTFF